MSRAVLQRVSPGHYVSPDGRWAVNEAFDASTARRGRGERYWVLSDLSGRSGSPAFVNTLADARQKIKNSKS